MNCYQKWSWAAGPASKGQVHRFLIKDEAGPQARFQNEGPAPFVRQVGVARLDAPNPAGQGAPGEPGRPSQGRPGGPGRTRRAGLGAILLMIKYLWFLDSFLNILPASNLLLKLDTRKDNHKLFIFLENRPYCPIVHGWKNMNDIAKIIVTRGPNYWSTVSNGIATIAINQVFNYWSSIGPIYC